MPRSSRIVIPNIPHHITQRGNRRQATFFCNDDYENYIKIMGDNCQRYGVKILAYCLMPNHVHLVAVPECEKALSCAIGEGHRKYTTGINSRMEWTGHLWQGRYFSTPMDERYLAVCVNYIEMNPVRAGLCEDPLNYPWSSAAFHFSGESNCLVDVSPMLEQFPKWGDFLKIESDPNRIRMLKKNSHSGKPLGSEDFLFEIGYE